MKIYNQNKTQELNERELDFEKGYLKADKIMIAHHEAISFQQGRSAEEISEDLKAQGIEIEESPFGLFRVIKEHEGGGRETALIEAEPATPAKEAKDEYEDIQVYIPYTESELTERAERKELSSLEKWFTEVYDAQVKQYNRCQRLGIEYDNKYGTIAELDERATINAKRISELRKKYSAQ